MAYRQVLLIDDDVDDQEIFFAALQKAGLPINCVAESDAREALQKLVSKDIVTDLIFLDLNMPVMSGQQFLTSIKKVASLVEIPVIIFSTSSHAPTISLTKELGAKDFITKPNNFEGLVQVLKSFFTTGKEA